MTDTIEHTEKVDGKFRMVVYVRSDGLSVPLKNEDRINFINGIFAYILETSGTAHIELDEDTAFELCLDLMEYLVEQRKERGAATLCSCPDSCGKCNPARRQGG